MKWILINDSYCRTFICFIQTTGTKINNKYIVYKIYRSREKPHYTSFLTHTTNKLLKLTDLRQKKPTNTTQHQHNICMDITIKNATNNRDFPFFVSILAFKTLYQFWHLKLWINPCIQKVVKICAFRNWVMNFAFKFVSNQS